MVRTKYLKMLASTTVLLSIVTSLIFFVLLRCFDKKSECYLKAQKINGPITFPIIGSSYVLFGGTRKMLKTIQRLVEEYKPILRLQICHKQMFFLARPEDIQMVLNRSLEKEDGYRYIRPVFGYGLFTRPVREWRAHRKTIVSTFNQHILNSFIDIFNDYSKIFANRLRESKDEYIDAFPILTQCTLDIMCSSVMGTTMNAMNEESQFIIWMTKVAELSIIRMFNSYLWPDWIWKITSIGRKSKQLDDKIQNYVLRVIENKRKEGKKREGEKKIFLDYLLELTDQEGAWSNDELANETRSVIMAGSDATAITLSYCFVMLAMFPDVQERIYQELHTIFGDSDRNIEVEDLAKMDYLERFIKETLRVFPVSSSIGRELVEDMTLGEYTLPKGSSIGIPIFYIHRNPEYWPDPLKFEPDRFLPEEVAKRHPCVYIPFSYGPRNCIGFKYGYMVMKVILANFLRKCRVSSTVYKKITDMKVKMDIATKCDEGYPVKIVPR